MHALQLLPSGVELQFLLINLVFQLAWMTLFWILCVVKRNGSMVDFAWPSGFTITAVFYAIFAPGNFIRRILLCSMYIMCGARFMLGWNLRKHWSREDHRWNLWRERWKNGDGILSGIGIRNNSIPFNLFLFYHCQSLATGLIMVAPLHAVGFPDGNNSFSGTPEIVGFFIWLFSLTMETIADMQLTKWKSTHKFGVCEDGLWKYSRHPNYFFEFLIWISYVIYALSAGNFHKIWLMIQLFFIPFVAYYFLVHFTGIWMAEQSSLLKRGEKYLQYQRRVSAFFPWFPASN